MQRVSLSAATQASGPRLRYPGHVPSSPHQQGSVTRAIKRKAKINQQSIHWSTWYCLKQTTTLVESDQKPEHYEESHSYLIGSPLFGLYVNLAIRRGYLTPLSLSLDVPHIVYEREDMHVFNRICQGASEGTDYAEWMSMWKVTPKTQLISYDGHQTSLSGVS